MILLWEVPDRLSTQAKLVIANLEIFSLNFINAALFIDVLYKMVITFKSVDEILLCTTIHYKLCCATYNIGQVYYILFMYSCA